MIICLGLQVSGCAKTADRLINRVHNKPPYQVEPQAQQLHEKLVIVDLHADTLLWNRDLLVRSSHGHIDLPRLQDGNIAIQVFGVVTQFPLFISMDENSGKPDAITLLIKSQDWPEHTWDDRMERAVFQAEKLHDRIDKSKGALKLITTRAELDEVLTSRQRGNPLTGAMLGLEGAHALKGRLENLDRLHELGFRLIGLNHPFDNEMSGSAHGVEKYGLTQLGRQLVQRTQELGMIIDLAHASPQAINDTLAMVKTPVVVSHTGVRATCDSVRNLSDPQIRAIAARGGVLGIGLFKYATCGKTVEDTVKAMRHVTNLVGIEHVVLGSDFDGSKTVFDASGLALLTQAFLKDGFTQQEIAAIMGGNTIRILRQTLH